MFPEFVLIENDFTEKNVGLIEVRPHKRKNKRFDENWRFIVKLILKNPRFCKERSKVNLRTWL